MKKKIFFLLFFIPIALICQTADSMKINKLEIGITFSPDYCYRTLKSDAYNKWIKDTRDTLEIARLGYTTGLNFILNINKKISLGSGFLFSNKGEKTIQYSLAGNVPSGLRDSKLPTKNTFIYHYYYIDIPVKVNYHILNKKIKLYLTTGISANIFLNKKTVSILEYSEGYTEKNKSTSDSQFSRINFAMIAGLGMSCPITNKFNFKLEPIYRHSITTIINAPIKEYLYSAGLNFGIYYKL